MKLLKYYEEQGAITLGRGSIISKDEMRNTPGNYPVYSSSASGDGEFGCYGKYLFDDERITWSIDGGGKLFYRKPHKYSVTNVCGWLKVNDSSKFLTKYIYYSLIHQWKYLEFNYVNKAHPSVIREIYHIQEIDIETQKKIVNRLDIINKEIEKELSLIPKYNELIKSRFIEMFGTLENNEYSLRIARIDEVCSLIKDGTHQTPQYTDDKINGYKFLSSKDVMSQQIDWTDIKYIPEELHNKLYSVIKPQRNDILMSKNGVNYGVAAVNDTDEIFDIYVSLALLRPTAIINPIYFRCVLNSPETKRQFDASIKGIGVPNLHLGEIKKTKILLPPIEQQNEFVFFAQQIDKLKFVCHSRYFLCDIFTFVSSTIAYSSVVSIFE